VPDVFTVLAVVKSKDMSENDSITCNENNGTSVLKLSVAREHCPVRTFIELGELHDSADFPLIHASTLSFSIKSSMENFSNLR
jgi:hypothetical protein